MAFFEERGDWLIDARRRWREGDPPTSSRSAHRLLLWWLSVLVAVLAVLQHLLGT